MEKTSVQHIWQAAWLYLATGIALYAACIKINSTMFFMHSAVKEVAATQPLMQSEPVYAMHVHLLQ